MSNTGKLHLKRTSFNKKAIAAMKLDDFKKAYSGKFIGEVDLEKVFVENGGKIK